MAEEEAKAEVKASAIRMAAINMMVEGMRYKAQLIARSNKYDSAITESGIVGFSAGILFALLIILVPALLM
jgi:tetrahydromethanopterin S-methyltransferase subunit F